MFGDESTAKFYLKTALSSRGEVQRVGCGDGMRTKSFGGLRNPTLQATIITAQKSTELFDLIVNLRRKSRQNVSLLVGA